MWRRLRPHVAGLRDGEGVAHAADREEVCVMRLAARLGVAWGGRLRLQASKGRQAWAADRHAGLRCAVRRVK